jgi:hypothetical protein
MTGVGSARSEQRIEGEEAKEMKGVEERAPRPSK